MEQLTPAIVQQAVGQGLWSMVSIFLIFYILKHNKEREDKFMEKLDDFSDCLNDLTICYKEIKTEIARKK